MPIYLLVEEWKRRGKEAYFEVRRCTLREMAFHHELNNEKCVLFPSPPVFPLEYKWWNPLKDRDEEVVLDQPIQVHGWLNRSIARRVNGDLEVEARPHY